MNIGESPDIDSNLLRIDSSSDSGGFVMPSMEPSIYDFSQQSTRRSDELRPGQFVKLVVPCFGEVGIRSVVDVTILPFSAEFILVRPSTIVANAENLFLEPCQRGCTTLKDALNRTILWRAADALALSEDPRWTMLTIFFKNPGLDWKSISWTLRVCLLLQVFVVTVSLLRKTIPSTRCEHRGISRY